jgi:hypothetical protein
MVLIATPAAAVLEFPQQCCACIVELGMNNGPTTVPAFFCEEVLNAEERMSFLDRCSDAGGGTGCVETNPSIRATDNVDCSALLLETEQIDCPGQTSAPVPLLGTSVLAALTLALAGAGAWAVRRRSSGEPSRS